MKEGENTKTTDFPIEETPSLPKSLRYMKSKWKGKEDKKTGECYSPPKENNNQQSDSEERFFTSKTSRPATNTSFKISDTTNYSTITLNAESEMDQLPKSETPSPEKSKRRKAFYTIKSYLEKNRSQQSIDQKNQKDTEEKSQENIKEKDKTYTNFSYQNSPTSNQLTIFEEHQNHKANKGSFTDNDNVNQQYSIDSVDTKLDEPKNLFEIFKVMESKKVPKETQNSQCETESELSSAALTLHKHSGNNKSSNDKTSLNPNSDFMGSNLKIPSFNHQTKMVSLFVGDLAKSVSENDLYLFFSKYEGLISVKIPLDTIKNESLSYGYVNFDNQYHADIATEGLNYSNLKGSEIRIMPSLRDKTQRESMGANLFFSKLSHDLSSRIMYDRLKIFGKILSCKYSKEKGTCFVNFADKLQAYKICKQFNDTKMDDRVINVSVHISKKDRELFQKGTKKYVQPPQNNNATNISFSNTSSFPGPSTIFLPHTETTVSKTVTKETTKPVLQEKKSNKDKPISTQYSIFIKNMPLHLQKDVVKNLVEPYGTVKDVLTRDVPVKQGSWALVTMTNKEAVDKTIQNLNAVEFEGKQLFVTRAIPREEKEYAKRDEKYPKKKLKLLISQIDLEKDKALLENWCFKHRDIKSAEFYNSSNDTNQLSGYGYIELNDEDNSDKIIKELRNMGVLCYKIMIEIPSKDDNFETTRYPYVLNNVKHDYDSLRKNAGVVSFSYVDPNKLYQLTNFQKTVNNDKLSVYQKLENNNKLKFKEKENNKTDEELLKQKQNEMYHAIWEICVRLFLPKSGLWVNQKYGAGISPTHEMLSKSKISSLTNHLIKFFWANNFEEFYKFMKQYQFDNKNRIIYVAHPVLANQIIQSATYLGIIPK